MVCLNIPNSASAKHPPCHALSFSSGLNILNTAFTTSLPYVFDKRPVIRPTPLAAEYLKKKYIYLNISFKINLINYDKAYLTIISVSFNPSINSWIMSSKSGGISSSYSSAI